MAVASREEVIAGEREALGLADSDPASALSISGGGIRSATFALGAIQALAQKNLLGVDYLSTVSGGGYIGSWLTAWKQRAGGIDRVSAILARSEEEKGVIEPGQITHLREYSNYLTPRLGLGSLDFWAIIAQVVRNVLLNWSVFIPFLMVVLFLPRLYAASLAFPEYFFYELGLYDDMDSYALEELNVLADSVLVRFVMPALAVLLFAFSQANVLRYLPELGGVDHSVRDYFLKVLLPLLGSVWALDTWNNIHFIGEHFTVTDEYLYVVGSLASYLLTILILLVYRYRFRPAILVAPLVSTLIPAVWAWLVYNHLLWERQSEMPLYWLQYTTYSVPLVLLGISLGTMIFVGLTTRAMNENDREWLARSNGMLILVALAWFVLSAVVMLGPVVVGFIEKKAGEVPVHSMVMAVGLLFGWISARTARKGEEASGGKLRSTVSMLIFLFILIVGLTVLTNLVLELVNASFFCVPVTGYDACLDPAWYSLYHWSDHELLVATTSPLVLLVVMFGLFLLSVLTGRLVNTNTYSLQNMYKNRLVRAYLGASNPQRSANPFSGFDAADDIYLKDIDPSLRPYHVINLAMNLTGSPRLQWQQRKAASFIASPLFCGSQDLGYRRSGEYGGRKGLTLGTAVATSGAAASPNMGYHSSALVTFMLALFNGRLGIWLGNPADDKTWKRSSPHSTLNSLAGEAFSKTSDQGPYVYLSDGGHFENLAIYEMVARRCSDILVLDGGCDPGFVFEDLGNALRKIEIDMGVKIEFPDGQIAAVEARQSRCALARILYPDTGNGPSEGHLIYVKPMLAGNESPSIRSYANAHPAFPHESTSDQWYDESQTESYRLLGWTSIMDITRGFTGSSLRELYAHILDASAHVSEPST